MINIYVGKPGRGKTYTLVKLAFDMIKKGRDVYSNFYIDQKGLYSLISDRKMNKIVKKYGRPGKIYYWRDIRQIVNIKIGEILMDEAQIYMNSRDWKALPKEVQYKLQQHRKHGVNIHGAVQNVRRIDTVCRELVNSIFELHRIGTFFWRKEYDIEDIDKAKRKAYSTDFYFLDKKLAACYDTLAEIPYNI